MIQYLILKKNSYRFMKALYKKFLTKDKHWHFFYEDTYMLLRLKVRNKAIEKHFDSAKIPYDVCKYSDPHPVVREYQDTFEGIFHGYSVLAMTVAKRDYLRSVNRVIHCYCNMSWENQAKLKTTEIQMTMAHVMDAAYTQGILVGKKSKDG